MISRPVSVVIPCFNQGHFLREALESVLAQTVAPREVVVVDDGSTDATATIASSYAGVTCVRQPNRGLARARNRGLHESSGEYVVFLDADDRLLPDALAIGLTAFDGRPHHVLVFGRCERIDAGGRRLPTVTPPPLDPDLYAALLRNNVIWTPAVAMIRRSLCEPLLGFNPAFGPSADYDLYLRLARARKIYGHGRLVAEYRLHDGSLSCDAALMLRSTVKVLQGQRRLLDARQGHLAAYEYGLRSFRHHYGDQLASQIQSDWRNPRRWGAMLRGIAALVRYHPGGVVRQSARHVHRVISRYTESLRHRSKPRARNA
jgi:glycosyltransferase involved in cell wall biosynthesis